MQRFIDAWVPHPACTSFNIQALSENPSHPRGKLRRRRVINVIEGLLASCDILCLQETKLGRHNRTALSKHFPEFLIFYNNYELHNAGTMILVRRSYAAGFVIEEVPHTEAVRGRVQTLRFNSISHPSILKASFHVSNVYLQSGHCVQKRFSQLSSLLSLDPKIHSFAMGDFNMTDCPEDSPSGASKLRLSGVLLAAWEALMGKLGLREHYQPTHTHFAICDDVTVSRSSRIDKIFSSLSDADFKVVAPVVFVAPYGTRSTEEFRRCKLEGDGPSEAFRKHFLSDHIPVSLTFVGAAPSGKRAPNLPKWAGSLPGLGERTTSFWLKSLRGDEDAFQRMAAWKTAAFRSTKWLMTKGSAKALDLANNLHLLAVATSLLRACSARVQDGGRIEKLMRANPDLKGLIDIEEGVYQVGRLSAKVVELMEKEIGEFSSGQLEGAELFKSFPTSHMPGDCKGSDPISAIRERLPSTRSHLTHLRASPTDVPSSDPQVMGDVLEEYYGEVWARNPQAASKNKVLEYLSDYDVRIPDHLVPILPTADDFMDAIGASNNSAAGPDGIPFSILRACNLFSKDLAQCLADIARELAEGIPPPPGFNHSRFYVLPKQEGGLVAKTRGLSVSNADNRLVATATAKKIEPALKDIIRPEQKGFTPERVGSEHVFDMLDHFYGRLSKKKQMYVLLLDTRRAFDTLSHTFLHECLRVTGFPAWFLNQIRGLLHEVVVFPVLSALTGHKIHIHRGVKQGCPLSPFLFILAINVLLWKLRGISGARRYAFADDLALALRSVTKILRVLEIVKEFGSFSDLHMNVSKTILIPARPPSRATRRRLDEAGWKDLKFSDSGVYLGVKFGPEVTTFDVFEDAFNKLLRRVECFRSILKTSSIHTKTVILNVFCTPLMCYLTQFYCVPYLSMVVPLRNLYRKVLIPFNGGGFCYAHVVTPRNQGLSLHTPLKDLWSLNMTHLGAGFDLEASQGLPLPDMGPFKERISYKNVRSDMSPSCHKAWGAFVLLEDHAPRKYGRFIDLTDLPLVDKEVQRRTWFYNVVVMGVFSGARSEPSAPTSMEAKLVKRLGVSLPVGRTLAANLRLNAITVRKMATPAVWNVSFRMLFNALPFDLRRLQAKMVVPERPPGQSPPAFTCHLCGEGSDSAEHVFLQCKVVTGARATLNSRVGTAMGNCWQDVLLAFPALASPVTAWLTVSLTYQVWRLRREHFATLGTIPVLSTAINKIVDSTLLGFNPGARKSKGSEVRVVEFASNPPASAVVGFTDGSAYPSGESGAGVTIEGGGISRREISLYLGTGDNNSAEAYGLLCFFNLILEHCKDGLIANNTDVLCFSDSAGVLGYLLKGWACPVSTELGRLLRSTYHFVKKKCRLGLWWIRGHRGVPGNEDADRLAKIGAMGAVNSPPLSTISSLNDYCFPAPLPAALPLPCGGGGV